MRDPRPLYLDISAASPDQIQIRCFSRTRGSWVYRPAHSVLTSDGLLAGLRAEHLWRAVPSPDRRGLWIRGRDWAGRVGRDQFRWMTGSSADPEIRMTPLPCVVFVGGCQIWLESRASQISALSASAPLSGASMGSFRSTRAQVPKAHSPAELADALGGFLFGRVSGP